MDSTEVERAHATLLRATRFLRGDGAADAPAGTLPFEGPYRSKVIANALRELDRFLNVLIDAAQLQRGVMPAPRRHNAANKLGACDARPRLLALGRSRDCLFHCDGLVRRGDTRGSQMLTAGWTERDGTTLQRFAVGTRLEMTRADLIGVADFYAALGARLIGHAPTRPLPHTNPFPASSGRL